MCWSRVLPIFAAALLVGGCGSKRHGPEYRESGVTIAWLRSMYGRQPVTVEGDVYITGRVVSTDEHGNFYKTLIVDDGTAGSKILT